MSLARRYKSVNANRMGVKGRTVTVSHRRTPRGGRRLYGVPADPLQDVAGVRSTGSFASAAVQVLRAKSPQTAGFASDVPAFTR